MSSTELMPLVAAIKEATGREVHRITALRWCNREDVQLDHVRFGGRIMTTVENVNRFLEKLTESKRQK